MTKRSTFWNDPKYQHMLKMLAAQELYAAEIAAKMTEHSGFTVTKNSIIGRAYRTGVELSQPEKIKRMLSDRGAFLQEWVRNQKNEAFRLKKLKEYYTKTG